MSNRELLDRDAIHPFRSRASSGEAYEVRDLGFVVRLQSRIFIAAGDSDRFSVIPFLHIAGVETIGSGQPRRGRRTGR